MLASESRLGYASSHSDLQGRQVCVNRVFTVIPAAKGSRVSSKKASAAVPAAVAAAVMPNIRDTLRQPDNMTLPLPPATPVAFTTPRLKDRAAHGAARFVPEYSEVFASIFTWWNALDALMATTADIPWQTGYVREVHLYSAALRSQSHTAKSDRTAAIASSRCCSHPHVCRHLPSTHSSILILARWSSCCAPRLANDST